MQRVGIDLSRKALKIPWTKNMAGQPFSLSVWLKMSWNPARTQSGKRTNPVWLSMSISKGRQRFQFTPEKMKIGTKWINYPNAEWFNLVLVHGQTDTMGLDYLKVYFNSILVEQTRFDWNGKKMWLFDQPDQVLLNKHERNQMAIANLLLYQKALHQAEITQNYLEYANRFGLDMRQGNSTPITSGLLAHYDVKANKWTNMLKRRIQFKHNRPGHDLIVPQDDHNPSKRIPVHTNEIKRTKRIPISMKRSCGCKLNNDTKCQRSAKTPNQMILLLNKNPNIPYHHLQQLYQLASHQSRIETFQNFNPEMIELLTLLQSRIQQAKAKKIQSTMQNHLFPILIKSGTNFQAKTPQNAPQAARKQPPAVTKARKCTTKRKSKKRQDASLQIRLDHLAAQKSLHGSSLAELWDKHQKGLIRIAGQCINQSAEVIAVAVTLRGIHSPIYVPVSNTKQIKDLPIIALVKQQLKCPTGTKWF